MTFYEIHETKRLQVYSIGTKATRRKAAVHYAAHSLSRKSYANILHFYGLSNGKHR